MLVLPSTSYPIVNYLHMLLVDCSESTLFVLARRWGYFLGEQCVLLYDAFRHLARPALSVPCC